MVPEEGRALLREFVRVASILCIGVRISGKVCVFGFW